MLLALQDDGPSGPSGIPEVPEGSTVMEIMTPQLPPEEGGDKGKPATGKQPMPTKENTSSAAKAILEKYMPATQYVAPAGEPRA